MNSTKMTTRDITESLEEAFTEYAFSHLDLSGWTFEEIQPYGDATMAMTREQFDAFTAAICKTRCGLCGVEEIESDGLCRFHNEARLVD